MSKLRRGMLAVLRRLLGRHRSAVEPDQRFEAEADAYHRAEERRYRHGAADAALRNKPFDDLRVAPRHLYRLSLALSSLDLGVRDEVLDFGAGTGWTSLMLNRMGIRTVALDISATAIDIGRRCFEEDPYVRRELEPEFATYDGRRLPFADERFDGVLSYDAFHHLPNQRQILGELHRVLKPAGRLVFCEPLCGHHAVAGSRLEEEAHGVLERDISLGVLRRQGLEVGFRELVVKPYSLTPEDELRGPALLPSLGLAFEQAAKRWLERYAVFYLVREGERRRDSSRPGRLAATIRLLPAGRAEGKVDPTSADEPRVANSQIAEPSGPLRLHVELVNRGDTLWLSGPHPRGGFVTLGCQLLDGEHRLLERDYGRTRLPNDVEPGERLELDLVLDAPASSGRYALKLDLVAENVCWFEEEGSSPLIVPLEVTPRAADGV